MMDSMPHSNSFFEIVEHDEIATFTLKSEKKITIDSLAVFFNTVSNRLQNQSVKAALLTVSENIEAQLDYKQLVNLAKDEENFRSRWADILTLIKEIEQINKPFVGIISGNFEGISSNIMSLTQYRIACKQHTQIGFTESKFGLFPSLGTVSRIKQIVGFDQSIIVLTGGRTYNASEALELGLVDEVVDTTALANQQAKKWIEKHLQHSKKRSVVPSEIKPVKSNLKVGIQACIDILSSEHLSQEELLSKEADLFTKLLRHPQTISLLRTFLYAVDEAQNSPHLNTATNSAINKIGILGAGMMGSGIAYEAARTDMKAVLKDVSIEQAERGKSYSEKVTSKQIQKGLLTDEEQQKVLNNIHATDKMKDLVDSDIIIEAIFEDLQLKKDTTNEAIPYLSASGFFASNTTSLPITTLSKDLKKPENFIGLHFFSPVDRMPLVEIIMGDKTNQDTLVKALKLIKRFGKTPIIVNDGPAFFTSRIFFNYILEGITMILEGIGIEQIEVNAQKAGFPIGPLAILDEISILLMMHVYDQLPELHDSQQRAYKFLKEMTESGRNGRKSGMGFYDYPINNRKEYWSKLRVGNQINIDDTTIQKRLLHVVALDSYRCMDEGILNKPIDGDIGSVLGIGYAPHTAGVFSHIDQVGMSQFVADCKSFEQYGQQWIIPDSLVKLAEKNFKFYTDFDSNWIPSPK